MGPEHFAGIDQLIALAAMGERDLSPQELQQVLEHVAAAGFDPVSLVRRSQLTIAEAHFIKHAGEWTLGTTLADYLASARRTVREADAIVTHQYRGQWQIGFLRESGAERGNSGADFVLVQYRLTIGRWVTVHQPQRGLQVFADENVEAARWLRQYNPKR